MAFVPAIDVSQWQGNIDWAAVNRSGVRIAICKVSGGDAGLYVDSKAYVNYFGAKNAGLALGQYHFAGGGNPENEADFLIASTSPLAQNDVLVLDWEIEHPDPVGWCTRFVNRVHDRTGIWPLFYTNGARLNQYDWTPVRKNCGTWVAWYGLDPNGNIPIKGVYVMHQYTSGGTVPGINGRVDLDAWWGTVDQFKKYGYQPAPTPAPAPPPPPPAPVPPPPPQPTPTPQPAPNPDPTPPPAPNDTEKQTLSLLQWLVAFIKKIFNVKD